MVKYLLLLLLSFFASLSTCMNDKSARTVKEQIGLQTPETPRGQDASFFDTAIVRTGSRCSFLKMFFYYITCQCCCDLCDTSDETYEAPPTYSFSPDNSMPSFKSKSSTDSESPIDLSELKSSREDFIQSLVERILPSRCTK